VPGTEPGPDGGSGLPHPALKALRIHPFGTMRGPALRPRVRSRRHGPRMKERER